MGLPIFIILLGGTIGTFILRAIANRLARQEEARLLSKDLCLACGYTRSSPSTDPCPECGLGPEAAQRVGDPAPLWLVLLAPATGVCAFMVFVGVAKNVQAQWLGWVFVCMVGPYAVAAIALTTSKLRKRSRLFLPLVIVFSVTATAISVLCYASLADGVFGEYGPGFDYCLLPFFSFFFAGIPAILITWLATHFTAAHESSQSK